MYLRRCVDDGGQSDRVSWVQRRVCAVDRCPGGRRTVNVSASQYSRRSRRTASDQRTDHGQAESPTDDSPPLHPTSTHSTSVWLTCGFNLLELESRRRVKFSEDMTPDTSNWWCKFEIKRSTVKVISSRNVNIVTGSEATCGVRTNVCLILKLSAMFLAWISDRMSSC